MFCPGPSSLNRPHLPHLRAHRDFVAVRLIRDVFAVPTGLGDPRVVPGFRWLFFLGMSFSKTPENPSALLHPAATPTTSAFAHLRRARRSQPPHNSVHVGPAFGASRFASATTCQVARLPLPNRPKGHPPSHGDFYVRASDGLVTLPAAGYHYGGGWAASTGGTRTR